MMSYGIANALGALSCGLITKYIGRGPIIALGASIHVGILITLSIWKPHPTDKIIFFILTTLWGLGDAVLLVTVNGTEKSH